MEFICLSTQMTDLAPLEINSYAILPVPENKSKTSESVKISLFSKMLNKASFAELVVGLAFILLLNGI